MRQKRLRGRLRPFAVQVKQTPLITDLRTQSGPERTFTLVITDNEGHLDSSRFFLHFYHQAFTRARAVPRVSTGS